MKIGLIVENSQASKNSIIFTELKKVAEEKGHEVINFGMFDENDKHLTYVEIGLISALLLQGGIVDFIVTGCGTGEGACVACNAFPGVVCGHVSNPLDAYLFSQVNGGNAIAIPFAQNYGWGGEINLRYIFEKLLFEEMGGGYPKERKEPEQANARILNEVKLRTHHSLVDILSTLDKDFVVEALDREVFKKKFFEECKDKELAKKVREVIGK